MEPQDSWPRVPAAAHFFEAQFRVFADANPVLEEMSARFGSAGVSILTLVDHWVLPETETLRHQLEALGLVEKSEDGGCVWEHPQARLPRVRLSRDSATSRLALGVDDVTFFLETNQLAAVRSVGQPDSRYEEASCTLPQGELAVIARRGYRGFRPVAPRWNETQLLAKVRAAFAGRDREGDEAEAIVQTEGLFLSVAADLGRDRAVDEFFAAEREFYVGRNRAAQWQYDRQQQIGIGWANHDHHTYRSSRPSFRALMRLWNAMGFVARERFYAGAEAGWGAQILEHPVSRVVIFADVDMAPEELNIDFARTELPPRDMLGTIGLWCALHGSSIARAGMHHLECEFDFIQAQANFQAAGFAVMAPFTNLPMLKQAFTAAELWPVAPDRVQFLREQGLITPSQAATFLARGAAGSHLEILQRWDGFKGFNKTGVSAIIKETDARRAVTS